MLAARQERKYHAESVRRDESAVLCRVGAATFYGACRDHSKLDEANFVPNDQPNYIRSPKISFMNSSCSCT